VKEGGTCFVIKDFFHDVEQVNNLISVLRLIHTRSEKEDNNQTYNFKFYIYKNKYNLIGICRQGKLSLAQIVRFLVMKSIHPISNPRIYMSVVYLWLIILLILDDVSVNSETFLMIGFINIKIFQRYS
jgi:Ni/Fe-hydrogenase subunit HybB-like protein